MASTPTNRGSQVFSVGTGAGRGLRVMHTTLMSSPEALPLEVRDVCVHNKVTIGGAQ